jgi:hypothetical protein
MENSVFLYAESARRKEQKRKVLQQGEKTLVKGKKRSAAVSPCPVREHRPPRPPGKQAPPAASAAAPPAPQAEQRAVKPGDEALAAMPVRTSMSQVLTLKPAPKVPRKAAVVRVRVARPVAAPAAPAAPHPVDPTAKRLVASEERLLLESQDMDLFKTGKAAKVAVCPECQHELVKVVCLGTTVRTCVGCKGMWLSYSVVREFSEHMDWFRQAGPAIHGALRPPEG